MGVAPLPAPAAPARETRRALGSLGVLLAEDSLANQRLAVGMLEQDGLSKLAATPAAARRASSPDRPPFVSRIVAGRPSAGSSFNAQARSNLSASGICTSDSTSRTG